MNSYFSDFVKKHGGDNVFSEKIGISRQAVGNIKRGASRATEKVLIAVEANFPDFDRAKYFDNEGVNKYLQEISDLKMKVSELEMKNKLLEDNQKMWIGALIGNNGGNMGKDEVYTSNQFAENTVDNIEAFVGLDVLTVNSFLGQAYLSDLANFDRND
jgi:hypothetical protein